jgi:hypothetical protein
MPGAGGLSFIPGVLLLVLYNQYDHPLTTRVRLVAVLAAAAAYAVLGGAPPGRAPGPEVFTAAPP